MIGKIKSRFKLPRELPFDGQVKGNEYTLGLTDGTTNFGVTTYPYMSLATDTSVYGANIGTSTNNALGGQKSLGITTNPTKSGIILNRTSSKYLNFFVN